MPYVVTITHHSLRLALLTLSEISAFESRLGLEDGTAARPVKFLDGLRDDQEEREMMGLPITFRPLTAGRAVQLGALLAAVLWTNHRRNLPPRLQP